MINKFNRPVAVEFDYSQETSVENMRALDKSMMLKSGLTAADLHAKLAGGILVSSGDW